jgi:hypothetical protein
VFHTARLNNSATLLLIFGVNNRVEAVVANSFDVIAIESLVKSGMARIWIVA